LVQTGTLLLLFLNADRIIEVYYVNVILVKRATGMFLEFTRVVIGKKVNRHEISRKRGLRYLKIQGQGFFDHGINKGI
jgi:hypothetical protein